MKVEDETPSLSNESKQDQESACSEDSFALISSEADALPQEGLLPPQEGVVPPALESDVMQQEGDSDEKQATTAEESDSEEGSEQESSIEEDENLDLSLLNLAKPFVNLVKPCSKEANASSMVKDTRGKFFMSTLTNGSLTYIDAPDVFPHKMSIALSRYSVMYTTTPYGSARQIVSLVRQALQAQLNLEVNKLPVVDIFKSGSTSLYHVLLRCMDAETHARLQKEVPTLKLKSGDQVLYNLTRQHCGLRVKSEVCSVKFSPLIEDSEPFKLLEHEDAFRVAKQFAIESGATACDDYPEAKDGLLQLFRERLYDVWADGVEIISDRNDFQLAMWIPKEVDRSKFLAYHVDPVTNRTFQFTFPGSDQYCSICRDNTKHGEEICPKNAKAHWPLSYVKLPL